MATALYLEQYLDSLENLPYELQRNFSLMRDLDQRTQDVLKQIDNLADDYIKNVREMPREKRADHLRNIQNLFNKSREYGDDKVQLAMQTYEMVDKHIRRLDADLARFEQELKEKNLEQKSTDYDSAASARDKKSRSSKKGADKSQSGRKNRRKSSDDETPKSSRKKMKTTVQTETVTPILTLPSVIHAPSDVLDMPVDPNEPTYCLCHQVSYGEMIGCDNPDCPIEWFHFACVGLTSKPKGKWFCPKCIQERKKK
ncbi:inhibitor of growth protein 4-like [Ptychodera flava]|uniref:inhibitor of growth protein 4-like n=1 Tax=Ptychodera flava TaxID=63121 RepID=UPI00396A1309